MLMRAAACAAEDATPHNGGASEQVQRSRPLVSRAAPTSAGDQIRSRSALPAGGQLALDAKWPPPQPLDKYQYRM